MSYDYIKFNVTPAEKIQIQKQAERMFLKPTSFARMLALGVKLEAPEIVYIQSEPVEVVKEVAVTNDFLERNEREMLNQLVNKISDAGYMNLNTTFQKDLKVMAIHLLKRDDSTYEET